MMRRLAIPFALLLFASAPLAWADGPDPDAIVRSLMPKPKPQLTRSLFSRGVEVDPDAPPEAPPQVELTVNFDFDSARLTNDGAITLSALGKALIDHRLDGMRFRIVGHTDAVGAPDYNLELSKLRAATVGAYLLQFYGIESSRLDLYGAGATQLRDPYHPTDGINRRVQVVTLVPSQ